MAEEAGRLHPASHMRGHRRGILWMRRLRPRQAPRLGFCGSFFSKVRPVGRVSLRKSSLRDSVPVLSGRVETNVTFAPQGSTVLPLTRAPTPFVGYPWDVPATKPPYAGPFFPSLSNVSLIPSS